MRLKTISTHLNEHLVNRSVIAPPKRFKATNPIDKTCQLIHKENVKNEIGFYMEAVR